METTFGECTDNEKKETVLSDCSETHTEGTSQPSVGFVGTARDDHLPVSIPGDIILKISKLASVSQPHVLGTSIFFLCKSFY